MGRWFWLLALWSIACRGALPASAQTTSSRGASVVVFPKVIADGTRDTVIRITNIANSVVLARCFYVNAAPVDPQQPPAPANPPQFEITEFNIVLTKQQPTYWVVSRGRSLAAGDSTAPGSVPAATPVFQGELLCVETSEDGSPITGNHLIGQATLEDRTTGDIAEYSGIGLEGCVDCLVSGSQLCLGGTPVELCANPGAYQGCPAWMLDHLADGAEDPRIGAGSSVRTALTIAACSQDLSQPRPTTVAVDFEVTNEFEERFSATTTVPWWSTTALADIGGVFTVGALGSTNARTRMRRDPLSPSGFMIVAQEVHDSGGSTPFSASAGVNAHAESAAEFIGGDVITLP